MFYFMNFVHSFVNYAIFRELCDRMRFEVDYAKSHHRNIRRPVLSPDQLSRAKEI